MKFFALTLLTVTAVVLCLLNVVSARNVNYTTAYEIARATRVQRALEDKRKQLIIDRAALLDPGRLSPIAARHGFKVATADQIVIVGAPQSGPVAPASAPAPVSAGPHAALED
jgi:cell division protein FtsL